MSGPKRIQRKRTKGWRMPEGAIYVGRPTKFGNPFRPGVLNGRQVILDDNGMDYPVWGDDRRALADRCVQLFCDDLTYWLGGRMKHDPGLAAGIAALRGKDLACWCPLDQPCHADVLLEIANGGAA